jgi:hypothetical protein
VGVAGAHEKINDEGHILDEELAQQLRAGLAGFPK